MGEPNQEPSAPSTVITHDPPFVPHLKPPEPPKEWPLWVYFIPAAVLAALALLITNRPREQSGAAAQTAEPASERLTTQVEQRRISSLPAMVPSIAAALKGSLPGHEGAAPGGEPPALNGAAPGGELTMAHEGAAPGGEPPALNGAAHEGAPSDAMSGERSRACASHKKLSHDGAVRSAASATLCRHLLRSAASRTDKAPAALTGAATLLFSVHEGAAPGGEPPALNGAAPGGELVRRMSGLGTALAPALGGQARHL